ncbi:MAG TPA: hypothetical protein VK687_09410 [Bryobacteraceae bacterium]|nr:hypothetical protein [Bryobacteraceae bacterium]
MLNRRGIQLLCLGLLCVVAYAPALNIPLLEDDYPNISLARVYGPPSGLSSLFHDGVSRSRATSYWVFFAVWRVANLNPVAYHAVSLLLHIVNTWLVFWIAMAWPPMRPAALWAAAFFAVHEGHQEAVMWFSAINELLMFAFGAAALLCWMVARRRERGGWLQVAGIVLFALALLSKESAVIFLPLFLLTEPVKEWRRTLPRLIPYAVLAAIAVASVVSTCAYSFRFSDGSFSLHAPFWITWPHSYFRLLWIWGFIAGAVLLWRKQRVSLLPPLVWIGVALVPYSFLTYSTEIPSRQVYLASVGLALLFGLAVAQMPRRSWVAAVIALMLIHNVGYLWVKKRGQFLERAAPTQQLIELARRTDGLIRVRCFPRSMSIAEEAVRLAIAPPEKVLWSETSGHPPAAEFCYQGR